MAKRFGLAVVLTNQVVDLIGGIAEGLNGIEVGNLSSLNSSGRRVCAALAIGWANCVNSRLFMSRNEDMIGGGGNGMGNYSESFTRIDIIWVIPSFVYISSGLANFGCGIGEGRKSSGPLLGNGIASIQQNTAPKMLLALMDEAYTGSTIEDGAGDSESEDSSAIDVDNPLFLELLKDENDGLVVTTCSQKNSSSNVSTFSSFFHATCFVVTAWE
ncbi:hypothetical protein K1719_033627 [Acacia pycnantha]|nr:hypothetical protein K1719_033627 [Acacia pycnantha]